MREIDSELIVYSPNTIWIHCKTGIEFIAYSRNRKWIHGLIVKKIVNHGWRPLGEQFGEFWVCELILSLGELEQLANCLSLWIMINSFTRLIFRLIFSSITFSVTFIETSEPNFNYLKFVTTLLKVNIFSHL